jgi:acyl-CoA hydrolase
MASKFQHQMVVRQEHLNHYGSIFGGRVLSVIDELAFIACARTYPRNNFVTRAIENAAFIAHARLGDMLEFSFGIEGIGRTSVRVKVETLVYNSSTGKVQKTFDGCVIMVCVDSEGKAIPVPR